MRTQQTLWYTVVCDFCNKAKQANFDLTTCEYPISREVLDNRFQGWHFESSKDVHICPECWNAYKHMQDLLGNKEQP